jgi:uncharacterized protein YegL
MILDLTKEDGVRPVSPIGRTYIAFVLDRSGSMKNILQQTIDGFNKQIDAIKKEAVGETFVSLVTFGTDVTPIFFNKSIDRLEYIGVHNYRPSGWTALYDAIGYTVNRLTNEAEHTHDAAFWVIIVSDGAENHSVDYKFTLPTLISNKQYTGKWTFTYVGSNQDLSVVSNYLNIPTGNTVPWTNDAQGTANIFTVHTNAVSNYFGVRSRGLTASSSLYSDSITTTGGQPGPDNK